jgi:hypothetical protein
MDGRTAAVTAFYRSRFHEGAVAWGKDQIPLKDGSGLVEIGGSGFGCLLLRRQAVAGETFASLTGEHPDFDPAFGERLRARGWHLKLDWSQRAEHLIQAGVELDLPHPARQALNFAKAVTKHIVSGLAKVDEEVAQARIATCLGCEHYRPSDARCSVCACPILEKARWESEDCPMGKWASAATVATP